MSQLYVGWALAFLFGVLVTWLADLWIRRSNRRQERQRRAQAKAVLQQHHLRPHLYLPSVGINDRELAEALVVATDGCHVVLNDNGELVGAVAPKVAAAPRLRLVVSND